MDHSIQNVGVKIATHWRGACRLCHAPLSTSFVDLGMSPLCESYLSADQINQMEPYYPLHALVCDECFLVQLQEYVKQSTFSPNTGIFRHFRHSGSIMRAGIAKRSRLGLILVRRVRWSRSLATTDICFNISYRWAFL